MAVDRNRRVLNPAHLRANRLDNRAEFLGNGVADRVRNIDGRSASVNCGLNRAAEILQLRAGRILRREFDVVTQRARKGDGGANLPQGVITRDLQLALQMNVGSDKEYVDAGMFGLPQCIPST